MLLGAPLWPQKLLDFSFFQGWDCDLDVQELDDNTVGIIGSMATLKLHGEIRESLFEPLFVVGLGFFWTAYNILQTQKLLLAVSVVMEGTWVKGKERGLVAGFLVLVEYANAIRQALEGVGKGLFMDTLEVGRMFGLLLLKFRERKRGGRKLGLGKEGHFGC